MAFDGLVISNLISELNQTILNGRIYKIYQPEKEELLLVIKNNKETYRLYLSASASLPLLYLTTTRNANPLNAPNFCMLLRKHLNNSRITKIYQPGFERIMVMELEHLNELGDLCTKQLVIELMGKHSNIIFVDSDQQIIDSIKHVNAAMSSVRTVLPGNSYEFPPNQDKLNPLTLTLAQYESVIAPKPLPVKKALYTSLTGISPFVAEELCYRSHLDSSQSMQALNDSDHAALFGTILKLAQEIETEHFKPNIIYENGEPKEFSSIPMTLYEEANRVAYPSISTVLETYYSEKNVVTKIRQKSSDLRKVISNAIERTSKKYDLQLKQLEDTNKRDKYRIYGELITTYGYSLEDGISSFKALNYYTNEEIEIPLDATISPMENAKKYFDKYNKLKRTYEALSTLTLESKAELMHLQSIATSLDMAMTEDDLVAIRTELMEYGYLKKRQLSKNKKQKIVNKPLHFISSDGYHIYVGKNNLQNEELTFKFANGDDWWFHAKGIPGSHVIVKRGPNDVIPDSTFEEASKLAGYFSQRRKEPKVEVDYTQRKNLKKPTGAKPGFVIYHTNYSMTIEPIISSITECEE
ncbi:MAG: NFACT RNA binding domain-containing protein [Lachnospiraceae bacterium]|nr:NFACT RNA binding domain-containing protein [Lachnospiraceae bacterium]